MTDNQGNKREKVQISLYASKLKSVGGIGSKASSPYAVVTLLAGGSSEKPEVLGKTEVIEHNLSPAWTQTFTTYYAFGKETKFNVGVFHEAKKSGKSKSMGSALFEIGEVLGARGNIKAKKLKNGGTLFVRVTKAAEVQYGKLTLQLRGVKLKNVDGLFGKSDPFFVANCHTNDAGGRSWQPVHRSEVVKNNLNPVWKEFTVDVERICLGDKNRPILFEFYDWEKSGKHQAMGKFQTSVNGLLGAIVPGGNGDPKKVSLSKALDLSHKGKSFGKIVVTKASVAGENLTPAQPQTAAAMVAASSSEHAAAAAAALPPPAASTTPDFSSALDRPPPSQQQQHQQSSFPSAPVAMPPPMAPPSMAAVPPPTYSPMSKPKFVDYLSGGTEISLAVAVDFTGSNGDPRRPGTLHYMHHDGQMNDYEKALTAVGAIVARYDSDQMFPVLGFGAKYGGVIQHCFQVGAAAELKGVRGMMEGYRNVFKTGLTMSGPTVFAEVIHFAAAQAQSKQEASKAIGKQSYTVLLILTDGAVTDIEQTKAAIRNASTAPLSIVIVGIGNADFSKMQFLDDFQRDEGGRTRDIVQFVQFNRHKYDKQALTRETLDEIPDQVVGYFHGNGIMPLPPVTGSRVNIFEEDYNAEVDIDLSVEVSEEGEIRLDDTTGATWDAHSYGTAAAFLPPAMAPPSVPGGGLQAQPPAQSMQSVYNPAANAQPSAPTAPYTPQGNYPSQPAAPHYPQQQFGQPPQPHNGIPTAAPVVVPSLIHIQAPANSYPGMQLQVQNPSTGQFQIVTIPDGVPPGSTFAVQL